MRTLIATICLTLAVLLGSALVDSNAFASDIDNKGIICLAKKAPHSSEDVGYWFVGGKVKRWSIKGNQVSSIMLRTYRLRGTKYVVFNDRYNPLDFTLFLNRQTLVLGDLRKRQCELVGSEQRLYNILQEEMTKGRSKNKL